MLTDASGRVRDGTCRPTRLNRDDQAVWVCGSSAASLIGGSAAFLIAPVFFNPLWRIAQRHNLGSLADVFAFRYPGEWVGAVVTVFMLLGVLPLIALQIQAAAATLSAAGQEAAE